MSPAKTAKSIYDFEGLRKRLGYNQSEMAAKMLLSPRTYFALETDPEAISQRHVRLAMMMSLIEAADRDDQSVADLDALKIATKAIKAKKKKTEFG